MFPIVASRSDEKGTKAIASVGAIYNVTQGEVGHENE